MMMRSVLWGTVVLGMATVLGCGSKADPAKQPQAAVEQPEPAAPDRTGGGESPQATFELMKAAVAKNDWAGLAAQMTSDSQDVMIGGFAMKSILPGPDAKALKALSQLLEKHGAKLITQDDLKLFTGDQAVALAALKKVGANVRSKANCIGAVMSFMEQNLKENPMADVAKEVAASTLADVQINGDHATVKVKTGDSTPSPMEFRNIDGKWYVDILAKQK